MMETLHGNGWRKDLHFYSILVNICMNEVVQKNRQNIKKKMSERQTKAGNLEVF